MKVLNVFLILFAVMAVTTTEVPVASAQQKAGAARNPKEEAKQYFNEGYQLYQAGEYLKAVKKLKMAYKLYPNPIILFYIAETYKEAELAEEAVRYYRIFLDNSLPNDPRRPQAEKMIKTLSNQELISEPSRPAPAAAPVSKPAKTEKKVEEKEKKHKKVRKLKPGELIHTPLEEAQPGRPARIEAELPEDIKRAWLYFYYRLPGDAQYTKVKMRVDSNDVYYVVLPCEVMKKGVLHYYIQAIGVNGRPVAHSGEASSPFIIDINEDNPLQPGGKLSCDEARGEAPEEMGSTVAGARAKSGKEDMNRRPPVFYFAVGATAASGVLFLTSGVMGYLAMVKAVELADAQQSGNGSGRRAFSGSTADIETAGIAYENTAIITGVMGVLAAGAAGYLWSDYLGYLPQRYSLFRRPSAAPKAKKDEDSSSALAVYPLFGDGMYGLGATLGF